MASKYIMQMARMYITCNAFTLKRVQNTLHSFIRHEVLELAIQRERLTTLILLNEQHLYVDKTQNGPGHTDGLVAQYEPRNTVKALQHDISFAESQSLGFRCRESSVFSIKTKLQDPPTPSHHLKLIYDHKDPQMHLYSLCFTSPMHQIPYYLEFISMQTPALCV